MKVREVMTTDVIVAAPDDQFKDVVERMLSHGVSGLPVVDDDGRLLGVVSETDLLTNEAFADRERGPLALVGAALLGHDPGLIRKASSRTARELMTPAAVDVAPDDDVHVAARRILDSEVNRLPVVEDGRLVGIVSRQDLLRLFRRPDKEIEAEIDAKLSDPLWAPEDLRVSIRSARRRRRGSRVRPLQG